MKDRNVGIVPVVESDVDHTLIGVATDRDLCVAVVADNVQPDTVTVQHCMATTSVTVRPDDDAEKALALMP